MANACLIAFYLSRRQYHIRILRRCFVSVRSLSLLYRRRENTKSGYSRAFIPVISEMREPKVANAFLDEAIYLC